MSDTRDDERSHRSVEFKAHFDLGIAYVEMGLYYDAVRSFERALQIDPTHEECKAELEKACVVRDGLASKN